MLSSLNFLLIKEMVKLNKDEIKNDEDKISLIKGESCLIKEKKLTNNIEGDIME
jgi:hypothetical protein